MPGFLPRCFIALAVTSLILAPASGKAGFEEGITAARDGAFETALRELSPLAESGHAEAQYVIGQMYYFGRGKPQSLEKAAQFFTRAAKGGWAAAQHDLAVMYLQGQGVRKNAVQSYLWFNSAAKQDYPNADRRRNQVGNRLTPSQLAAAKGLGQGDKRAAFRSGSDLLDIDRSQQGYFLQGMADLLWETQLSLPSKDQFSWTATCLRNSTAGELVDMYTKYLKERPEEQSFAAAETFIVMMKKTCAD